MCPATAVAAVGAAAITAAVAAAGGGREQPQPGLGGKGGTSGGGVGDRERRLLGPWKEALEGQGPVGPLGTVPGWTRAWGLDQEKTRTEILTGPFLSPQGCPHLCPRCSSSNSVGAGGTKYRSSWPLCRAAGVPPPPALSPRPSGACREMKREAGRDHVAPRAPSPRTACEGPWGNSASLQSWLGLSRVIWKMGVAGNFASSPHLLLPGLPLLSAQLLPPLPLGALTPTRLNQQHLAEPIDGKASVNGPRAGVPRGMMQCCVPSLPPGCGKAGRGGGGGD